MIEAFWLNGIVVNVPAGWDFVTVDGVTFRREYNARGETRWVVI